MGENAKCEMSSKTFLGTEMFEIEIILLGLLLRQNNGWIDANLLFNVPYSRRRAICNLESTLSATNYNNK